MIISSLANEMKLSFGHVSNIWSYWVKTSKTTNMSYKVTTDTKQHKLGRL